jgi:hypothetical protein
MDMIVSRPLIELPVSAYNAKIIESPIISAIPGTSKSKSLCFNDPYANNIEAYWTVILSLLKGRLV